MKLNSPTAYSLGVRFVSDTSIGFPRKCFRTGYTIAPVDYLFGTSSLINVSPGFRFVYNIGNVQLRIFEKIYNANTVHIF